MIFKSRRKKSTVLKRLVRSFVAIIILTAFVLGVAYFVRGMYGFNADKFARVAEPVSGRLGLNAEEAGEVAGKFIHRVSQTGINTQKVPESKAEEGVSKSNHESDSSDNDTPNRKVIALVADSGNDFDSLRKAMTKIQGLDVDYVVHLGDHTDWGDVESLSQSRAILDESGLFWHALPGDHDLAETMGVENFLNVFGVNYEMLSVPSANIMIFDNSANFTLMDEARFSWFLNQVDGADIVLLSQPIYHPTNERVMGIFEGEESVDVRNQAKIMLSKIRKSEAKAIFGADQHMSSVNVDPEDNSLSHIVVGALASSRNLQTPRFTLLYVYEDGTYEIEEVIL
jgi:hypothetical protein